MADTHTTNDIETLKELLDGIRFTMFTTQVDGRLRGRPLTTLEVDPAGSIWFFIDRDSEVAGEVRANPTVGLAYNDDGSARYVSVSGTASLRDDRARVEELWNPLINAWFDGKDDPSIQPLEVRIDAAEYWDGESNRLVRLAGVVAAAVTGNEYDSGERGEIRLRQERRGSGH